MCYLDDFTVLVRRASRAAARHDASQLLDRVKAELQRRGLASHKDQIGEEIEALGVVLDCTREGLLLRPAPGKFQAVISATKEVLRRKSVDGRTLQTIVGHWAWWLQLRRPLYSVLQEVYPLIVQHGCHGRVVLPPAARRELRQLIALAPCVRCRLDLPVSQRVHMVDAGPRMGAVVACRLSERPVHSEDVGLPPRARWQLAVQRPWLRPAHNNIQEAKTVLWAVERCVRAGERSAICVIYTDSLVVKGAFDKGRSSSRGLNRMCRRHAALCAAFGLRVVLRYVASAANWADGPSRGLRYPCVAPETCAKAATKAAARPPPGRPPGLWPGLADLP